MDDLDKVSVRPGFSIPGWSLNDLAYSEFTSEGLKCPVPGCIEIFKNDNHGKRYTAEKWKAHVSSRELHYFLWYDPKYCYQPPALRFTFIRVDKRHKIAVCHFRREPVQFSKLEEHCSRCKGCLGIDKRYENDPDYQSIRNITKQQLQRDGVAIQGFEACEAFHCCTKLYGSSVQGFHAHLKTSGNHNPSGPTKCMRYRTTKHGYAYVPISDLEYEKLTSVHDEMLIVEYPRTGDWQQLQQHGHSPPRQTIQPRAIRTNASSKGGSSTSGTSRSGGNKGEYYTVESFRNAVLHQGYSLFEKFYYSLAQSCISQLDEITWNHQNDITAQWTRHLNRVYDNHDITSPGYSFAVDGKNLNGTNPYIVSQIAQSPGINLFKDGLYSSAVRAYEDKCDEFLQSLMVLIFCSIANTPSPGECLQWTFVNTETTQRSMLITLNNQVEFRVPVNNTTGNIKNKYLPWITGELLIRYLRIVRPFEIYLAQHVGTASASTIQLMHTNVFMGIKFKTSECDLSDSMRKVTPKHLEKAASEHVWKSLLHTIMDRVSDKNWNSHTFNEAWFNSTGLNRMKMGTFPGLGDSSFLNC